MKLLICGLGSIGYRHLQILKSNFDVEVGALRSGKSTVKKSIKPDVVFYKITDASNYKPDGVLITNPTSEHISTALYFAKEGIPLFIEKPLGYSLDGIDELVKICVDKDVPVLMGCNLIHHPAIIKIKELLENNKIGEVYVLEVNLEHICLIGIHGRIIKNLMQVEPIWEVE